MALLHLMNPITCATEYFGGIDINMWIWSDWRCPSNILHSFFLTRLCYRSPICFRIRP